MKDSERISLNGIINHFRKFSEKQKWGMDSFHAQLSCWGEGESLSITIYSKEKKKGRSGSKISISASMNADNYNLEVMELKLKAEYAEEMHKLSLYTS